MTKLSCDRLLFLVFQGTESPLTAIQSLHVSESSPADKKNICCWKPCVNG